MTQDLEKQSWIVFSSTTTL